MRADIPASTLHGVRRVLPIVALLIACGVGCRSATAARGPALDAVVRPAEAAEMAALPEGAAKALLTSRCLVCHGAGLIAQQRKDAAAWGRTVTQMAAWSAPIPDEDRTALVAYLAEHYGPGPLPR